MSAAAIKSTSARRFAPTTYENVCNRCQQLVYSAEKIGPLKDFTFYHHGCFKCAACGSKLTLKTYYNNQQDQDDKEVSLVMIRNNEIFRAIEEYGFLSIDTQPVQIECSLESKQS